jgi:hypothetical protein
MNPFFSIAFLFLLAGCAPAPKPEMLDSARCGSGEFRGQGAGRSEAEALDAARSDLAKRIYSSVTVSESSRQGQFVSNGKENLSSQFVSKTITESALPNAHDAHTLRIEQNADKIGIVVCMSRSNAASGFIERQRLITDSLGMVSNVVISTEHPKRKNDAWHKTQVLMNEIKRFQKLLEGWGVADTGIFESANEIYAKTEEHYKTYCKHQKVYWTDTKNEYSKAVFAELSKKVKIEKSACLNGLNLNFSYSDGCKSSAFGIECFLDVSVAIESCSGESYTLLNARATGNDMHNEAKAKEKLIENLSKASFFKEWAKQINEWGPQCAE